ncbi:MAG: TetR/AcrR family transcriptional regulator [Microthrixaceae bacterium]
MTNSDDAPLRPRPTGSRWEEILEAATAEFRDHGYEGANVREIATRVGMLKGSLYNYISGKADLFVAVVEKPAMQLLEGVEALADDDGSSSEKLRKLVRLEVDIFSEHYPSPFVYLARVQEPLDPRFQEWDERYFEAVKRLLQSGVDRGEFHGNLDVEITARALLGMLAWMLNWYEPRGTAADDRIVEAFSSMIESGVTKSPS